MRTKIGDFLRKLRIENEEVLKTMADKLGVTSAFLSAVENGKKKMPEDKIQLISDLYNLSEQQSEDLKLAAMESYKTIPLNIENVSSADKELAITFARKFDSLDEETSKAILKLLKKRRATDGK